MRRRAARAFLLQAPDQARRVPAPAAHLLEVGVELIDEGRNRQARAVAAGLVEHQTQVLAHPVHGKTEIELVGDHGLAAVVELPALGGTLADHVQHLVHVQSGLLPEGNGLAQALHQAGDADLVDHLGQLAGAAADLNGGFRLKSPKDLYADYLNVTFQLRPGDDVSGDFYLAGAFNDWNLSPSYKLNFNGDFYDLTIPLKRGIYDYQYVVVNGDYNDISSQDWYKLEGNDWTTKNEYNIFLWYRDQENGGYDRIIGYTKIER